MSDTKLSALSPGGTAQATDVLPIARGGANYSITPYNIQQYILSGGGVGLTVNSTAISGGSAGRVLFDDGTKLQESAGFSYSSGVLTTPSGYTAGSGVIVTDATTARTLSAAENGKVLYFTNASPVTVTTAVGLGAGFSCTIIQGGAGKVSLVANPSTTIQSYGSLLGSAGQYATLSIICPIADTFLLAGALG